MARSTEGSLCLLESGDPRRALSLAHEVVLVHKPRIEPISAAPWWASHWLRAALLLKGCEISMKSTLQDQLVALQA